MSVDLAAAHRVGEVAYRRVYFDGQPQVVARRAIVEAVAAEVEAQVREQVAREIAEEANYRRACANEAARARGGVRSEHQDAVRFGLDYAARIARGGAR